MHIDEEFETMPIQANHCVGTSTYFAISSYFIIIFQKNGKYEIRKFNHREHFAAGARLKSTRSNYVYSYFLNMVNKMQPNCTNASCCAFESLYNCSILLLYASHNVIALMYKLHWKTISSISSYLCWKRVQNPIFLEF